MRLIASFLIAIVVATTVMAQEPPPLDRSQGERNRATPNRPQRDRDEELDAKRRIESDLEQAQFRTNRLYLISSFELDDIGIGSDLYIPADEQLDGAAISLRAPQKLYYIANRRMLLSVDAIPGYVFYVDSDRDEQLSWKARGDVHFLFPFFYINVWTTIADELIRDTSELARLVPRDSTEWGINTEIKPSSRTNIKMSYNMTDIDFDATDELFFDQRLNLLERTASRARIEMRHHTFPITHLIVGAEVTDYAFPITPSRNSDQTYFFVGADRERGTRHFIGRIGYSKLDYKDPDAEDFSGILGDLALTVQPSSRNQLGVRYRRDLEFSVFGNNQHYLADRVFVDDTHDLTSRLRLHLQAQAGLNSYEVPFETVEGPIEREDELYFLGAGASFRFFKRLRIGAVVGPWERRSNIPGEDADGIRWHILLSFNS